MFKPFLVLFSLASLGSAPAQEPPSIKLPPRHSRSGQPTAAEAALDPVSLYRSRSEAAAAAFQAAYRAVTAERRLVPGMRLFLVSLRREPRNPAALFDMAILCERDSRWSEALSFLGEARGLAAPGSETALAIAAELPRAQAIERLQRTPEGKTRRAYDQALLAALAALPRAKDPFAGLAAVTQLVQIDKARWEGPALNGMLHAQTGQFAESNRDLEQAAALAGAVRAPSLKSAAEIALREAGYLDLKRIADPLWEGRQWEQAAKAYAQAWEKSPRHSDVALLAVTGYLMVDQVEPAVQLLSRLPEAAPDAASKANAMLKALSPVSEAAAKAAARPAPPAAAAEQDPAARIALLVGPLNTPEMELASKPEPVLLADRTPVTPIPDKELDSGDDSWTPLSTESLFQIYQSGLPPPPAPPKPAEAQPAAALPAAENPAEADSTAARGNAASIESRPAGAQVVLDNTVSCTTPCLIALAPGRHTYRAELTGYRVALGVIEAPKNSPPPGVTIAFEQKQGFLEVESTPPGAPVFIDGKPTDRKTPARFQLTEGKHQVGIEVDGKVRPSEVTVTDSGETVVRL